MTHLATEVFDEFTTERADRVITFDVADIPPCDGDPGLLRQVFANLFDNALKYTRSRSETQIAVGFTVGDDGEIVYSVSDNGVGFDMRYIDKLFGVFQRLHRSQEYEGTGVGLANVQRIIHRHGGRIWAEAAVDRGATFYFTIGKDQEDAG